MAQDATGTPTALGIPRYNPAGDSPSGRGFNAAMDAIDAIIAAKQLPTPGAANQVPVWNGANWIASVLPVAGLAAGAVGQTLGMSAGIPAWLGGLAKIQDITLGSPAQIDFTSIPTDYAHLLIMHQTSETGAVANDNMWAQFNGDTSSAYSYQFLRGNAATASASESVTNTLMAVGLTVGSSFGSGNGTGIIFIPNYKSAMRKMAISLAFSNSSDITSGFDVRMTGGVWRVTSVINRVNLIAGTGTFTTGSRATLYGLGV